MDLNNKNAIHTISHDLTIKCEITCWVNFSEKLLFVLYKGWKFWTNLLPYITLFMSQQTRSDAEEHCSIQNKQKDLHQEVAPVYQSCVHAMLANDLF